MSCSNPQVAHEKRILMANFYSTTAGSFIEPSLSIESENPNLFIIHQSCLDYTTTGSLIQSSLPVRSINRTQFLINQSLSDQRRPVSLIKQNLNPHGHSERFSVVSQFTVEWALCADAS